MKDKKALIKFLKDFCEHPVAFVEGDELTVKYCNSGFIDKFKVSEGENLSKELDKKSLKSILKSKNKNVEISLEDCSVTFVPRCNGYVVKHQVYKRFMEQTYMRAILDSIPGYVSWIDSELKYLGVNETLAQACGLPEEELVGQHVGFLKTVSKPDMTHLLMRFFNSNKESMQAEIEVQIPDKDPSFHLLNMKKYGDGSKAVLIGIDITDLKLAEKQVEYERAKAESSAQLASLGEMAAGVAHEVNNPLAIIKGYMTNISKMIERKKIADNIEKVSGYMEKTINATERISRIIHGLKTFSRQGDSDPFERSSLKVIFEDCLALTESPLLRLGIDLQVLWPDEKLEIECRAVQVCQVIVNLLNNSRDAIEGSEKPWIKLEFFEIGEYIKISITDSGNGIPPEVAAKIFEPFYTTKGVGKGTGLGLSLSRSFIEQHGGRFSIDRANAHTKFDIILPKFQALKKAN